MVPFPVRYAFISVTSQNLDIEIIEGAGERGTADVPHPDKAYFLAATWKGIQKEIRGSNGPVVIQ